LVYPYYHLQGYNASSLTLNEEHRLRVFEKRLLSRIFGPKRDEVAGERKKLYNEELHDLYSSSSIIRLMKSRRCDRRGMYHEFGRRGTRIGCWWESQNDRGH
jgi:hypothetical protein